MRILHVIDHWGLGGAQRALSVLLEIERQNDHRLAVLFAHRRLEWSLPDSIEPMFLVRGYAGALRLVPRLRRAIHHANPDVIHVHLTGSRLITAMALRTIEKRPVVIWHEHSANEYTKRFGSLLGGLINAIQRLLGSGVDGVVANSDSSERHCTEVLALPPDRVRVISCSILQERICADAEKYDSGQDPEKPVIGFVGRLAKQKGIFDFLEVAKCLVVEGAVQTVWIIGDGPERRRMERRVSGGNCPDRRFVFWGFRKDVYALMRHLDVILMPSYFEPFGLVAVEAFVLGRPVIGYDVDGLSHVLRTNALGLPVTVGDRNELRAATKRALQHPPRHQWQGGEPEFLDRHGSAKKWAKLYGQVGRDRLTGLIPSCVDGQTTNRDECR